MKTNYTHIAVLLDASYSMTGIIGEMREGVNNYLKSQKEIEGECTVTIVKFSGREIYKEICSFKSLNDAPVLTKENYYPIDSTALVDSMCRLIDETGKHLSEMKEEDRPEKMLFLCITDGQENNSIKFSAEDLKARVNRQENEYKWQFVYLGANQDAFQVGNTYGVASSKMSNFNATSKGIKKVFESTIGATTRYRNSVGGQSAGFNYTADEQKENEDTK